MAVRELAKQGQQTANEAIGKTTQTVYEASFKKFSGFCVTNSYPDPRRERHHELPVVLVAYLQSISASSSISLQTAEKARFAVVSYFSSNEHSDGTDVNTWCVREEESGAKHGYGNPARDPFVRQFMRGLKKKRASEYFYTRFSILRLALRDSAKKAVCGSRLYLRLPFTSSSRGRMLCSIARRLWQSGACITYTRGQSRTCYRRIHALVQLRGLRFRALNFIYSRQTTQLQAVKRCASAGERRCLSSLRRFETLVLETKAQISQLAGSNNIPPQDTGRSASPEIAEEDLVLRPNQTTAPELSAVKEWAHLCLMWWVPDESLHFFKPLSKWSPAERAEAWIMRSRLSVAKMLGEDIEKYLGEADQSRRKERVLPVFHSYYTKHYVGVDDAGSSTSITIAMLASFIRKDRKNRIDNSRPA
ncbi:hypothetical protein JG688_00016857 [Phytophthora aleatoria]|uniref:Uncharacterized protein n=1 Tax=Phytophthora aleatoria TaxID=2496075 RepID=A0A8J5IXR2_9STRA|nr:hypothetical protein JG688_00016857 [Phytophthora aleatoria]